MEGFRTPVQASPRRLSVALLLTSLMPGLGHVYCGRARTGLGIWAAVLGVFLAVALAWARWLFVPVLPIVVLVAAWTALQLALAIDLRRIVRADGADYRLRPLNHGLTYLAVFLGLGVLPVGGALVYLSVARVASVEVSGFAMFPRLLPGDRVLVDRRAFVDAPPRAGELVVVAWGDRPAPGVGRVIATGGNTVHLRDGRPVIDGGPLERTAIEQMRVARFGPADAERLAALDGYLERLGERAYVVTYARQRPLLEDPPPVVLRDDEIFVLGDNRDAALEARAFGRVSLDRVLGRPRYVWASFDVEDHARAGRVGLAVR
ncbi:MAG: signal peptidase I [Myxococcales bacterium]|nr:signal peptidase I [Myxococcales bacterium]